jgi:hypothetical protein
MHNPEQDFSGGKSLFPLMTGKLPPGKEGNVMAQDNRTRFLFWGLLLVAVGFGLLSIFYLSHRFESLQSAFESLGHAFIIASFLAATVDLYVKNRLLKEASYDISKYLIGYALPNEIQDKIKEAMRINLVRRDLTIAYTLSPVPGNPDRLFADVLYVYKVENLSNQGVTYQHRMSFEKHQNPKVLEMRIDSEEDRRVNESKLDLSPEESSLVSTFALKPFTVKPRTKNPDVTYECSIKYRIEFPTEHSDAFAFVYPTINVRLTAEWPLDIEFIGPYGEPTNTNRWYFKRGFLVGEHVSFRWRKRLPEPSEESNQRPTQE